MKISTILIAIFSAISLNLAHASNSMNIGTGPITTDKSPSSSGWDVCQKVNQLRFVANNDLKINEIKVNLINGKHKTIKVKANLKAGEKTRWLKLGDDSSCITRIHFKGIAKEERASVEILGRIKNA